MPKFNYTIKTTGGETRSGQIEASSQGAAAELLTKDRQGVFVTTLTEEREKSTSLGGFSLFSVRISLQEKLFFVQQLAIMIKSGLAITGALRSLRDQTKNKGLKQILDDVLNDVKGGQPLSSALAKHPQLLPDVYVQIIAAGEKSGKLDRILLKLAKDLEKSYDLRGKIRGAMIYPIFLMVVIIAVVIIVLTTIVPQLKSMFADVGVALPITTRMLIGFSDVLLKFWWLLAFLAVFLSLGLWRYAKTDSGKHLFDTIRIKIPIFGTLNQKIYLARFTRTLDTLTSAGMPILNVFTTLSDIIGNTIYAQAIKEARTKIEAGYPVSAALSESKYFQGVTTDLIAVGEKSGNLGFVLKNLTRFYERDVDAMTKNLSTMLEPVMMVVMGVGVAFIVASVIMPIYGLVQVIK